MTLSKMKLNKFTAFEELELDFSPGINVFVGANGTGKTHILKTVYAACEASKPDVQFADKLLKVFLPSANQIGRLVKRSKTSDTTSVEVLRGNLKLNISFSNHAVDLVKHIKISGDTDWKREPIESIYIPPKDMLSNAQGFRSLYKKREIHFEEFFVDILDLAYTPLLRGPMDKNRSNLLRILQEQMEGKVVIKNEEFFLRNKQGNLEFSLLAEGFRKLGLLWLLIQNGSLSNGSILFWDEPEANLNPKMIGTIVDILLELQRNDTQIFIATHDYVVLQEIDLQQRDTDNIKFYSLYKDGETNKIISDIGVRFTEIHPNVILDTFSDLYDREVRRSIGGISQ